MKHQTSTRLPLMKFYSIRSLAIFLMFGGVLGIHAKSEPTRESRAASKTKIDADGWISMFDGESLKGWKITEFAGKGDVLVKDKQLILDTGFMTGVSYSRPFPKIGYEIELESQRADGFDFFCGLTFPVKDSFCSWIVGGWGGGVVGLSSLDDLDASENETTKYLNFEAGKFYRLKLRVEEEHITAWIDGEKVVDVSLEGRKVGLRPGSIEMSKPLGLASWSTKAIHRNIRYRVLKPSELQTTKNQALDSENPGKGDSEP